MITLHHCVSARSLRPLWMLEEIGLAYELKMWPFPPRALARSYFDVNPLGTVPTLVEGDVRMTESVAICQYLAARHSAGMLDVGVDETEYGDYLNHLYFGEATLTFPQTLVLRYSRFESPGRRQPTVADDYTKWFLARLRAVGSRLETRTFVCADRFTAADISIGYALLLGEHLHLNEKYPASVQAYWARLQQRPAYRRTLQAQEEAALAQGVSPLAPSLDG
jgi:glutathione S-transferase